MTVATMEATLRVMPDASYVAARTAVGVPPSNVDPAVDEMRVLYGTLSSAYVILRAFDPGAAVVTVGAPFAFATEAGDTIVTEAADDLLLETA